MTPAEKRRAVFETMPVKKAVLVQIAPSILSQMVALLYNLADTYFVGLLNDPIQTAALTVSVPPYLMLTAVSNLFGIGGASVISRALGEKQPDKAKKVSAMAFWLGTLAAVVFSLLFCVLARPILTLCGGKDGSLLVALSYTRMTVVFGGVFTVLSILLANLLRAEGRAGAASWGLSLGGILNIILDPFFVLPRFLGMGATGAGLATAISNLFSMLILLLCLLRGKSAVLSLSIKLVKDGFAYLKQVLFIGIPSAVQFALTVVGNAALSAFVSKYGQEAVAALGIAKKIDMLPLYFAIGVANGLLPLLAYNYGAGNHERRRKAFAFGCTISVTMAVICLALYQVFAPQLAGLFMEDTVTVTYAAAFLRRMVVAMPLMALSYALILQFQAMGKSRQSLICSLMRKGTLDVPLFFLMDRLIPLYGCMWVQVIVDTVSMFVALGLYMQLKKQEKN